MAVRLSPRACIKAHQYGSDMPIPQKGANRLIRLVTEYYYSIITVR